MASTSTTREEGGHDGRLYPPPLPAADRIASALRSTSVTEGERIDNIDGAAISATRQFSGGCGDANDAMRPAALTEVLGRRSASPSHSASTARAMNKGFYLTLMMGSFNASPVPRAVIEALTDVQVTSSSAARSASSLKFTIGATLPSRSCTPPGSSIRVSA